MKHFTQKLVDSATSAESPLLRISKCRWNYTFGIEKNKSIKV